MSARVLRYAVALTRWWTALYTMGTPEDLRDARRAEIDSDLWECQQIAAPGWWLPRQILWRLLLGIHDDLGWRVEHRREARRAAQIAWTLAVGLTGAVLVTALWLGRAQTVPVPVPPPVAAPPDGDLLRAELYLQVRPEVTVPPSPPRRRSR